MSTTLAYACPKCGRPCCAMFTHEPEHVWCHVCVEGFTFAPWSYQEVLGAIGLEGLYQLGRQIFHAQRMVAPSREDWIKMPALHFLEPSMTILALQAGVVFSNEQVMAQAAQQARAQQFVAQRKGLIPVKTGRH